MFRAFAMLALIAQPALAQTIITCGASEGRGYFFTDDIWNPDGPNWQDDRISNGAIRLVLHGDEIDIEFGDIVGNSGYRADGANVVKLLADGEKMTVGAFHTNYVDTYTFDFINRVVIWTSHKLGPLSPKTAIYKADCK